MKLTDAKLKQAMPVNFAYCGGLTTETKFVIIEPTRTLRNYLFK